MTLAFRPMLADDLPWVAEVERQQHVSPWSAGNFADSLEAGYSCWVAFQDVDRVGYAILLVVLDDAHLLNITVTGAVQRGGIGSALLGYLCGLARQAGAQQMFLEVRPSNHAALALYQRNGFELVGRRKGYYPGPDGREDAMVMRLPL